MSYYMGDYYQGDPGFFSFLGGLAKKAVGLIPGVGPGLSAVIPSGTKAAAGMRGVAMTAIRRGSEQIIKHPVLSGAAAAGAVALGGMGVGAALSGHRKGHCRKTHISRKTGREVCNRRMNPCNPKALRRAIRRARGFEHLAMKVLGFSRPHRPKGHPYFKKVKRR